MTAGCSRRQLVRGGLAAGASLAVAGFDPRRRAWITAAEASGGAGLAELPPLDGTLRTDPAAIEAFSHDFGGMIASRPRAVLEPGSVGDVAAMVRFARKHGLEVSVNGQAGTDDLRESHSCFGQALVGEAGIAVDPRPLAAIFEIRPGVADVGAGARWSEVFDAAAATGQTPPVLNDYMHLSVGGTLSIGGIGGRIQKFGAQVDNVLEIEVVTGRGERVTASRTRSAELFRAVLGGVGQCGLIVRAKLRLVPAPSQVLVFHLFYDDLDTYLADQKAVLADGRFDYQEGQIVRRPDDRGWRYLMEVAAYVTPPAAPNPAALLGGLRDDRAAAVITTQTFREHAFRIDPQVEILKRIGRWTAPKPWLDCFVPASETRAIVGRLVDALAPDDIGTGVVLLYPLRTDQLGLPLFRVPREPVAFSLSVLRFPPPGDPDVIAAMLADNRRLYDEVVRAGGTRYPNGAVPDFSRQDWRRHFGSHWGFLVSNKRRFDPDNVLTPGQRIFR